MLNKWAHFNCCQTHFTFANASKKMNNTNKYIIEQICMPCVALKTTDGENEASLTQSKINKAQLATFILDILPN